ncbi:MAG: phosphoribosylamine--glycine ligase [Sulfobacillus sp.]|nr:phosphoribosylamine--glycine ligase [Sulfobacillus sp.]
MREVIVVGQGAREHAIAWGLKKSGATLWSVPGNPGLAEWGGVLPSVAPESWEGIFRGRRPLVVIGPEAPLADGLADRLRALGYPVVGPGQEGARLESSKRHAKEIMDRYGIPTAAWQVTHRPEELHAWIQACTAWPRVMKQSRLAQGKGVVVAPDAQKALAVWDRWREIPEIWEDGVIWEEALTGEEISVLVAVAGGRYRWLPVARDYKRLTADPHSPNTGGMGAYAPVWTEPPADLQAMVDDRILDPMMRYLHEAQIDYRGILYVGLMLTAQGPYVLEFNVRLGDPETEAIMPILDIDWYDWWWSLSQGQVPTVPPPTRHAVTVVMAAPGYPDTAVTGIPLHLGTEMPDTVIFQAGTRLADGRLVTHGGRVLAVTGWAADIEQARHLAYERVRAVTFPGAQYRTDIGVGFPG